MSNKHRGKEEQITQQIKKVQDQQYEHQQALKQQEQLEQEVYELNKRSRRLLRELNEVWAKDKTFASTIEKNQNKLSNYERNIDSTLEDKKEGLLKEKQKLYDEEEDLYHQRRSLIEEEDEK